MTGLSDRATAVRKTYAGKRVTRFSDFVTRFGRICIKFEHKLPKSDHTTLAPGLFGHQRFEHESAEDQ